MPAPPKTDRKAILELALARVQREGLHALSLRSLASDVGIATNALYHYFGSRSELSDALSDLIAARLCTVLSGTLKRHARRGASHPADRIRTLAAGYLRFARREPNLYTAMIDGSCHKEEPHPGHAALWTLVYDASVMLHGEANAAGAAVSLWALLHGTISLLQSGALEMQPDECVHFGLQAWLARAKIEKPHS